MDDERSLINDTFLISLFQVLTENPEMTATEVLERTREKGILLAPTIGRQQSEYLGPMIERELDLLSMQGLIDAMPPELKEAKGEYRVIYDSPISRTMRAEYAAGAQRTLETFMNAAQMLQDPSLLFFFNFEKAAPEIAEINGTPSSWMRTPQEVQQMKAQHAKMQQQQQAIQAAPAVAGLVKAQAAAGKGPRGQRRNTQGSPGNGIPGANGQ
jgi:Bacteriophage head to tail connecting protein